MSQEGLLLTSSSNVLTLFPPPTIERKTVDAGLDILEDSLK